MLMEAKVVRARAKREARERSGCKNFVMLLINNSDQIKGNFSPSKSTRTSEKTGEGKIFLVDNLARQHLKHTLPPPQALESK